jgi:hypothetical protein
MSILKFAGGSNGKRESAVKLLNGDVLVLSATKDEWKLRRCVVEATNIRIMKRNNTSTKDVFNFGQPGSTLILFFY